MGAKALQTVSRLKRDARSGEAIALYWDSNGFALFFIVDRVPSG